MTSLTVPRFWGLYRRLPEGVRQAARGAYQEFVRNPAHPGLRFHRLQSHVDVWSVRVTRDYRPVGLVDGNSITWFWIGSHAEFDRVFRGRMRRDRT